MNNRFLKAVKRTWKRFLKQVERRRNNSTLRMTRNFNKLKRKHAFRAEVEFLRGIDKQLRGTVIKRMVAGRAGMPYAIPTARQLQLIKEAA